MRHEESIKELCFDLAQDIITSQNIGAMVTEARVKEYPECFVGNYRSYNDTQIIITVSIHLPDEESTL